MGRVYSALVKSGRWSTPVPPGPDAGSAVTRADRDGAIRLQKAAQDSEAPGKRSLESRAPLTIAPRPAGFLFDKCRALNVSRNLDPGVVVVTEPDTLASARYNTLAVRLMNFAARRQVRTIAVTSALEGEGKTTVAANLAAALARRQDRPVLLIDADQNGASMCRVFRIAPRYGLSDVAEGRSDLYGAIARIDPCGFYLAVGAIWAAVESVAGAGNGASSARARLDIARPLAPRAVPIERLAGLIAELRTHFEFVVIDTPAIAGSADTQRLTVMVDGTVMVVRASSTNHKTVADALRLVPREKRLGLVLNQSDGDEEPGGQKSANTSTDTGKVGLQRVMGSVRRVRKGAGRGPRRIE